MGERDKSGYTRYTRTKSRLWASLIPCAYSKYTIYWNNYVRSRPSYLQGGLSRKCYTKNQFLYGCFLLYIRIFRSLIYLGISYNHASIINLCSVSRNVSKRARNWPRRVLRLRVGSSPWFVWGITFGSVFERLSRFFVCRAHLGIMLNYIAN